MKQIFEEARIGNVSLKNRLVRSAMWENLATEQGGVTERLLDIYENLAKGGVGLIITGYAFVTPDERPNPGMMGMHDDAMIDQFKRLTDMVHQHGGRVVMQIAYGGSQTNYQTEGRVIWGPSEVADLAFGVTPTAMSKDDIRTLVRAFGAAAARVKAAGFDGVQVHGAHGYLLSQFLAPYYNRRTDEYGGSIENRARIIEEVYQEIRRQVGDDFPVLLKFNAEDFIPDGHTFEESRYVARRLAELGVDALEISAGTFASGANAPCRMKIKEAEDEAYQAEYAAKIADEVDMPVLLVGGLRSPEVIEGLLQSTGIEFFSMARPLLAEPDLPKRWQGGDRARAKCSSCNVCFTEIADGVSCVLNK